MLLPRRQTGGSRAGQLLAEISAPETGEEIFLDDPSVLTISLHQHPLTLWPSTGWPTEDGEGPGPALFSASKVELYAAFLLPLQSNSSGVPLERHESQSRTPHTVMPLQRATARQSLTTLR